MALDFVSLLVAVLVILLGTYYVGTKKNEAGAKKLQKEKLSNNENETTNNQGNNKGSRKHTNKSKKNPKSTTSNKKTASSSSSSSKHPIPSDPHFIKRYGGHKGTSRIVAFSVSPDGDFVATSGTDGLIRVTNTKIHDFHLSTTVQTPGMGVFQDYVSAISWLPNNNTDTNNNNNNNTATNSSSNQTHHPTIVGVIHKSRQIAFYRIRKKKSGGETTKANNNSNNLSSQYELIELVKRRFDISNKIEDNVDVTDCIADVHQPSQHWLILTKTYYDPRQKHPNTVAWGGDDGSSISSINIHSSGMRISPDGKFVCGRTDFNTNEVKIYEIQRKKQKGESQPIFESISSKSVMTIVVPKDVTTNKGAKISDITFCGDSDNIKLDSHISLCIVGYDDGTILVFDINVEYQQKEDPKLVCCYQLLKDIGNNDTAINRRRICCMAATKIPNKITDKNYQDNLYRIAVATDDSAIHLLTYSIQQSQLSFDLTIPETHPGGVGEVQFCPSTSNILYTTGKKHQPNNRSIYSWRLSS